MKNSKLTSNQQTKIKQLYLQYSDEQLSEITGSNVKDIRSFMKSKGLVRNQYTQDKLDDRVKGIKLQDSEVVEPLND